MSSTAVPAKRLLAKGLACASCKARKVKCDAIRPACTACRRSAKFRGEDPTAVRCCYFDKKKDSTGGAGGKAKRARMGKRRLGEEAIEADVVVDKVCKSSLATPLAPVQPPPAPASPLSGPSTSTSTFPLPFTSCQPSATGAPLPLLAPIAVYPAALPAFLGSDPLPAVPIPLAPSDPPTQSEFDAFLQSLVLSPASIPALPPYGQPSALDSYETASPSSPSSTTSFSSSSSIGSDGSAFSSHLNSPFSLCEDYDLAFASSYPPYQPLPPAFSSSTAAKALPGWTPPTNEDPHVFVDAFLPTAHDCDKTLALPLFEERWAFNPLR